MLCKCRIYFLIYIMYTYIWITSVHFYSIIILAKTRNNDSVQQQSLKEYNWIDGMSISNININNNNYDDQFDNEFDDEFDDDAEWQRVEIKSDLNHKYMRFVCVI